MTETDDVTVATRDASDVPTDRADELPVVARLVVEIRSDGSRTVARGALEDRTSGQQVAIEAEGASPLALSLQLARALVSLPAIAARSIGGADAVAPAAVPWKRPSLRKAIRGALARRRQR